MKIRVRALAAVAAVLVAGTGGCSASVGSGAGAGRGSTRQAALSLVVVGDSIPNNAPADCPGCDGFVDQYARALAKATGRRVETTNLSQHNNLTVPMLLGELSTFRAQLSSADAVIVGVAHNTIELNADRPCGTRFIEARGTFADWSKLTTSCARRTTDRARALYDRLYATIASWRAGKPTILRTIDKYNDWIGAPAPLTSRHAATIVAFHDLWNRMLCASAQAHGFACADVYHAFNGPDGTRASGNLLGPDYTHPSQLGNDLIARTLIALGFAPLAS